MTERQSRYVAGDQVLPDSFELKLSRAELVLAVLALRQAVLDWERYAKEPHERNAVAVLSRLRSEEYQALATRLGKMLEASGVDSAHD
jgi:hypothetical protein